MGALLDEILHAELESECLWLDVVKVVRSPEVILIEGFAKRIKEEIEGRQGRSAMVSSALHFGKHACGDDKADWKFGVNGPFDDASYRVSVRWSESALRDEPYLDSLC